MTLTRLALPLLVLLASCGVSDVAVSDHSDDRAVTEPEGADFVFTPTDQALTYAGGAPLKVFINFNGGSYTYGNNDSSRNVSSAFRKESGITAANIAGYANGASARATVLDCVRQRYGGWNVVFTDQDPGAEEHSEIVVGGSSSQLGWNSSTIGIAPLGCDVVVRAVGFAFTAGREGNLGGICETIAHELGHTLSLDHLRNTSDLMYYMVQPGSHGFTNANNACGETGSRNCICGGTAMNAVQRLNEHLGAAYVAPPPGIYQTLTADFDGDGKTDLATVSQNARGAWDTWAALELSRGSGFASQTWNIATAVHMRNGGAYANYKVLTGDFNGDGRADLATISPNGGGGWANWVAMELSTGSGFSSTTWNATTPLHMRNGGSGNDYVVLTGDFNGDRKTDLATITRNGGGGWSDWVAMELSTGSGFSSTVWRASTPIHMRNGGNGNEYQVLTGDFNGDGKTDLATITKNGGGGWADWVALELSTGSGFSSTVWRASTPMHMRNGGSGNDYRVLAADFNGDGKTDLATFTRNGGGGWADWAALELSTGSGFTSTVWATPTPMHMRNGGSGADYRILALDVNGDRKADVVTLTPNGGGGWASWASVDVSTGSGFANAVWNTVTPLHMRNGGSGSDYRVLPGDFNGDKKGDLMVLSPNAGGGWADWASMNLSTGSGFSAPNWACATPIHMRNGNK